MRTNPLRLTALIVVPALILGAACSGGGKPRAARNGSFLKQVNQRVLENKLRVLQVAIKQYTLEFEQPPKSLDELVEKQMVSPDAILDGSGNRLPFTVEDLSDESTPMVTKSCGACGKRVSSTARVGERCPFCGVVWGFETQG